MTTTQLVERSTRPHLRKILPQKSPREKFIPIKLNTSKNTQEVLNRLSEYYDGPARQLIFRGNPILQEFGMGPQPKLLQAFTENIEHISQLLMDVIESYKKETIKKTPFIFDIEELSARFFEEVKPSGLMDDIIDTNVLYKDLPFEEKETLRQFILIAIESLNENNGLNIRAVNKGFHIDETLSEGSKCLTHILESSTSEIDIENGEIICAELRKLEMGKEEAAVACRYDRAHGYDRVIKEGTSGAQIETFVEVFPLQWHTPDDTQSSNSESDSNITWIYCNPLKRYIPVHEGIMKAKGTTDIFIRTIHSMSENLKGKTVFQIGYSHGAITTAIARVARKIVGVDVLKEAFDNASLTLETEEPKVKDKVTLLNNDLSYLEKYVDITGEKADYLFFNCPIFRGYGDPNSLAGEDFDVIKRTLLMLPKVLKDNGKAYLLVAYPITEQGRKRLWTIESLRKFLNEKMPEWEYTPIKLEADYNEHGKYGIVEISRKT